jgi:hypothetical protein
MARGVAKHLLRDVVRVSHFHLPLSALVPSIPHGFRKREMNLARGTQTTQGGPLREPPAVLARQQIFLALD